MSFDKIQKGLISDSVLAVRASDVLSCRPVDFENCDFGPRWQELKVPQQVRDYKKRAEETGTKAGGTVRIPAAYKAGITLFAMADSATAKDLLAAGELPLLGAPAVAGGAAGKPVPPA